MDGGLSQTEFELKATATARATAITSNAHTLTFSRVFVNGPNENTVIPMDECTYEVVTHPDEDLIGTTMSVNLPRNPITLGVEQQFYNRNVRRGGVIVDDRVFNHRIGDADSYPGPNERDQLMATSVNGRGLSSFLADVGQGSGADSVGIEVDEQYASGAALELGFEIDVSVTGAAVLAGFSVGASQENTVTVLGGTTSTYDGTVGRIPPRPSPRSSTASGSSRTCSRSDPRSSRSSTTGSSDPNTVPAPLAPFSAAPCHATVIAPNRGGPWERGTPVGVGRTWGPAPRHEPPSGKAPCSAGQTL